jgi:starch phosphorylase
VRVAGVDADTSPAHEGDVRTARARIDLGGHGGLGTDEVAVQLLHGAIDSTGAFVGHPEHLTMHHIGDGTFEVDYRIDAAGAYGLTVRVLPRHDGLLTPVELGRATWAN